MARRIEDLRLALGAMSAPDPRDPWHAPVPASYAPDAPRRVHVVDGAAHAPVREAIRRAAIALQAGGYEIDDDGPPDVQEAADTWARLMASDSRRAWPALDPLASPGGRRFMEAMFELVPPIGPDEYAELFATRLRLARAWAERQRTTPLVLAPIFAGPAFRAGADLDGAAADIVAALRATLAVNLLGLPAVAVPVGLVDGLPQAAQVIGPRFGEELCLRAAEAIEAAHAPAGPIDPRE